MSCALKVSESAGSTGTFLISGAGSAFNTAGTVVVGQSLLWRVATGDTLDYGSIGGAANGTMTLQAGGSATSSSLTIGSSGSGTVPRTTESATGQVVLDGIGSAWNIVRTAVQTGGRTLVALATGQSTNGSLEVRNGATMKVDGSSEPGEYSGLNLAAITAGATTSNAQGTITVKGTGSRLDLDGGIGFVNVGRGFGTTGTLTVSDGGFVGGSSNGETGLVYMNVGQGGGTGTVTVSGAGSLLRFNGRQSATNSDPTANLNGGSFLSIGRGGGGAAGNGIVNVTGGGRIEIDTTPLVLTNPNGQTGLYVGAFNGSTGQMTVSGPGSTLLISGGTGMAPYVGVGRDSGTGSLVISNGGRVEVSSLHTSVPNTGGSGYLPGDLSNFEIGRRTVGSGSGPTTGTVTVTGAGSQLLMSGNADAFIQVGRGVDATGTLNILNGGQTRSSAVFIGTESGSGALNMSGGHMVIDGVVNGGPTAGSGGGLGVGRGGATGVANVSNGSTISISSSAANPSVSIGGSSIAPGGTGTFNLSGGSALTVNGPNALIGVGRFENGTQAGIGTLTLSGAGTSAAATGSGAQVLLGSSSNTIGTVIVGAGASLSATALIGVAHDGTASTGGIGTLIVHGTATAADLIIGATGLVGGNGVINANVTNFGVINPGNTPGLLSINGNYTAGGAGSRLILEVESDGAGGFKTDEVRFSFGGAIDLAAQNVEFSFLGNTDPNAFQASGLFDIDTFVRQANASGAFSGLAAAAYAGVSFAARADAYTISNFTFSATGGAVFTATPVPEAQSWLMLAAGLMALGVAKRRAA
ncbi:MAG: hypothetical protein H7Z19_17190 [Chitinophagaceae bacterium]|nr:hypothetical protein [Rubrivivax sp.]